MEKKESRQSGGKRYIARSLFSAATIAFFAIGSFCSSFKTQPEMLGKSFFSAFGSGFEISLFVSSFLYILFPFAVTVLSAFDHLGSFYSFAALSSRAFLSGYSSSACISELYRSNIAVYIAYTLSESLILIVLISSCVDQRTFRRYCISRSESPLKSKALKNYLCHASFRLGLLTLLFICRSIICIFII